MSSILQPSSVKIATSFTSKKRLFQEIGEIVESSHEIAARSVVDALQDRENLGPTGVGGGIALPHARLDKIERVHGIFIRTEKPFNFDSVDRKPVDLIFALLAPEDAGVEHLKALAIVSRTMRNAELCAKLRANNDPTTLHAMLTEAQRSQAA